MARAVLSGQTRGYRGHPQLVRFRDCRAPLDAINGYLHGLFAEACARGYAFDGGKLPARRSLARLTVTRGQLEFELRHLRSKLRVRDPGRLRQLPPAARRADTHPLFRAIAGPVEDWERGEARG